MPRPAALAAALVLLPMLAPALAPALALAHSDMNGPHGGEVEDANPGPYHFETAVQGNTLSVFVTDADEKPVAVAPITGFAVVLANKVKQQVALAPVAANQLQGSGSFAAGAELRVLVSLVIDGQKQQALFSPPARP